MTLHLLLLFVLLLLLLLLPSSEYEDDFSDSHASSSAMLQAYNLFEYLIVEIETQAGFRHITQVAGKTKIPNVNFKCLAILL